MVDGTLVRARSFVREDDSWIHSNDDDDDDDDFDGAFAFAFAFALAVDEE